MNYGIKITFILSFLCLQALKSQNFTVFDSKEVFKETYDYRANPDSEYQNTNHIIFEIAKGLQKNPAFTKLQLDANLRLQIIRESQNLLHAFANAGNVLLSGETTYRGFMIAKEIIPDIYTLQIEVTNTKSRQNWVKDVNRQRLDLSGGHARLAEFEINDTMSANYIVEIKILSFSHSSEAVHSFDKKIKLIDEYYHSEIAIGKAAEKAMKIEPENVDMIPLYDFQLREAEKILSEIKAKNFPHYLQLQENDPIKFIERIYSLEILISETRGVLNGMLESLDRVYYHKGLEYLSVPDKNTAAAYFEKSLVLNPFYTPAHYQLARINLLKGNLQESAESVNHVLTRMKPDNITLNLLNELGNDIHNQYIIEAEELMQIEKYPEAIELLDRGRQFCSSTPGIICSDKMQRTYARAKYGMYNAYLTIARRALENSKPSLAETYANEAWNFQKNNQREIINASEVFRLHRAIAQKFIVEAEENIGKKMFGKALNCIESAERIYSLTPDNNMPDIIKVIRSKASQGVYDNLIKEAHALYIKGARREAENKINEATEFKNSASDIMIKSYGADTIMALIKRETYKDYIYRGEQYIGFKDYQKSLEWLTKAEELEQQYPIQKNVGLRALIQHAAKPIILERISEANIKLWGNMLEDAADLTRKTIDEQLKYHLQEDKELNEKLADLQDKLFTEDCLILKNDYDNYLQLARQNINAYDYITGNGFYVKAAQAIELKPDCKINPSFSLEMIKRYTPAADFQLALKDMQKKMLDGDFSGFLKKYEHTEVFYNENSLERYALKMPMLLEVIYSSNSSNAIAYFTNYYITKNERENALKLLKKLKSRNYPVGSSRQLQEDLAVIIARSDKEKGFINDASEQVNIYTAGDRWFRFFRRTYLREFKTYEPGTVNGNFNRQ